ncbi:Glutaminyl-peptide cyclotransferase-like protein [Elsinoe australis]|uniref:Peptide hydrolase n=1 Tax=Elsinoe australis TaxID=40998 RepID=A0A2P7ZQ36_9PEZI|nr:Glutaminyl-peptide cyclotransferase-like protein [Elsinoe australis]
MRFSYLASLAWLWQVANSYTPLSDGSLKAIPSPGKDFDIKDGSILAPILIPRVPGTPGSVKVLSHFVDFFQQTLPKWNITFQNSTATTPTSKGKEIPFVNLIATRDPPWARPGEVGRLNLVAHYDSKLTPTGFIGAIDSAAPCAMILHAIRSIDEALAKKWEAMQAQGAGEDGLGDTTENQGLQVLLLDGEEAFNVWSDSDSLYGARSLAEEWEITTHGLSSYQSPLQAIDLFVLLDLLGSAKPQIPSYFKTTHWAYKHMADVEARMRNLGLFKSSPNHPSKRNPADSKTPEPVFMNEKDKKDTDSWLGGHIGDDHVPFMARGVEILHMIPSSFPDVWHEITDDGEHLDMDTVEDWAQLVTAFAAEWMDLEPYMGVQRPTTPSTGDSNVARDEFGD